MFYSVDLLRKKKTRISACWIAATSNNFEGQGRFKLSKDNILSVHIKHCCEEIIDGLCSNNEKKRMSLYLTSKLTYGALRIFQRQVTILNEDVKKLYGNLLASPIVKPSKLGKKNKSKKKLHPENSIDAEENTSAELVVEDICQLFREKEQQDTHLMPDDDFFPPKNLWDLPQDFGDEDIIIRHRPSSPPSDFSIHVQAQHLHLQNNEVQEQLMENPLRPSDTLMQSSKTNSIGLNDSNVAIDSETPRKRKSHQRHDQAPYPENMETNDFEEVQTMEEPPWITDSSLRISKENSIDYGEREVSNDLHTPKKRKTRQKSHPENLIDVEESSSAEKVVEDICQLSRGNDGVVSHLIPEDHFIPITYDLVQFGNLYDLPQNFHEDDEIRHRSLEPPQSDFPVVQAQHRYLQSNEVHEQAIENPLRPSEASDDLDTPGKRKTKQLHDQTPSKRKRTVRISSSGKEVSDLLNEKSSALSESAMSPAHSKLVRRSIFPEVEDTSHLENDIQLGHDVSNNNEASIPVGAAREVTQDEPMDIDEPLQENQPMETSAVEAVAGNLKQLKTTKKRKQKMYQVFDKNKQIIVDPGRAVDCHTKMRFQSIVELTRTIPAIDLLSMPSTNSRAGLAFHKSSLQWGETLIGVFEKSMNKYSIGLTDNNRRESSLEKVRKDSSVNKKFRLSYLKDIHVNKKPRSPRLRRKEKSCEISNNSDSELLNTIEQRESERETLREEAVGHDQSVMNDQMIPDQQIPEVQSVQEISDPQVREVTSVQEMISDLQIPEASSVQEMISDPQIPEVPNVQEQGSPNNLFVRSPTIGNQDNVQQEIQRSPTIGNQDDVQQEIQHSPTIGNQDDVQQDIQRSPTIGNQDDVHQEIQRSPRIGNQDNVQQEIQCSPRIDNQDDVQQDIQQSPRISPFYNGMEHNELIMSIDEFEEFLDAMWIIIQQNIANQDSPKICFDNFLLPHEASREEIIVYLMYCCEFEKREKLSFEQEFPYEPLCLIKVAK